MYTWPFCSLALVSYSVVFINTKPTENKDAKIIIVGAGMAGVAAGKKLYDAGYTNFQILEASSRVGGRLDSVDIHGYQVEEGGMWIYGKGTNPVWDLVLKYNLSYTDNYADDWTIRNDLGEDVTTVADEAYEKMLGAMYELDVMADTARVRNTADFTVRASLLNANWRPQNTIEDAMEVYVHDFETGIQPSAHSGKYLYLQDTFTDLGSEDMLIVNDQRGFAYLVERLADEINDTAARFVMDTVVSDVTYFDVGVNVTTTDGVYFANYVLITVSLGVLQQRLITFSPPLPPQKQFAIDKFSIALYTHVYVKYQSSFWDDTMYIVYTTKTRGKLSIWTNMNAILPGSNILQVSLFNEFARWADHSSDDEVLAEITSTFETLYPNNVIPPPADYKISRWNTDPLYKGAFAFWPPTFTQDDMQRLQGNVRRLYFAGDYAHELHYGFLHGSYLTGERSADDIMKCIQDPTTCVKVVYSDDGFSGDTSGSSHMTSVFYHVISLVLVAIRAYL